MATNPQISYAAANAEATALIALMNSGKCRVYSGTVPTRCDDSIGAATLLVEGTMSTTSFAAVSNGVLTANAIVFAAIGTAGTASFFRIWDSAGTTAYIQGNVGTSAADMILNAVGLVVGAAFSVTSLTHTVVRGA